MERRSFFDCAFRPDLSTMSVDDSLYRGEANAKVYGRVIRRTLLLFFLGLMYYGFLQFNAPTEQRYVGFLWGEQPDFALVAQYDNNRHWRKVFIINVDDLRQKLESDLSPKSDSNRGLPGCRPRYRATRVG